MPRPPDLLPGTLDLLILRTLQSASLHGWAISERIQQVSEDVLQINQGSLYPCLHRLEHQGWIEAEWAVSEHEVAAPVIEQVRAVSALFLRSVNVHVLPAPGLPFTCTLKVENVPPPASLIWTFASTASPLK